MTCKLCYADLGDYDPDGDNDVCVTCGMRIARRFRHRLLAEIRDEETARAQRIAEKSAAASARRGQAVTGPREPARPGQQGPVVYYIRIGDHVKIGYTANLVERMRGLRAMPEQVLAVEPGGREVETLRHRQFKAERVGRWENFNPSPGLLDHIGAMVHEHGIPDWLKPAPQGTRHATPVVVTMRDNP